MMDKFSPYLPTAEGFSGADAAFLAREGFDVVRLGVDYAAVEPRPGVYDGRYLNAVAAEVRMLGRHGILVLLSSDLNCWSQPFGGQGMPSWMSQTGGLAPNPSREGFPACYVTPSVAQDSVWSDFYANNPGPDGQGVQTEYVKGWARIAARLRRAANVIGYDTLNEPWPGGATFDRCLGLAGCAGFDRGALSSYTRRVAAAVHDVDRRAIVWAEPNIAFDFGSPTYLSAPSGDSGFAFHDYCLAEEVGTSTSECAVPERQVLANAAAYGRRTGSALLLSEFGATDNLRILHDIVTDADAAMVPWIEWAFFGKDPCCARPQEGIVRDIQRPPDGRNVKWSKLGVLVRPYPQIIAGTPIKWSFDPTTRTFRLTYRTARAGGGHLPPRLPTEVFVPRLHYPHGYRARVNAGRVTSSAGARELIIEAAPGARRVKLVVSAR